MKIHKKFESANIRKYWRDQKPPIEFKEKFIDLYFPPSKSSLFGLDQNGNNIDPINGVRRQKDINIEELEWKSVPEIFGDNFLLFENKIDLDDIKQGNLGNCYFLSAIAALSEFPYLIYQIFRSKKVNEFGYYEIVFFIDGEWQIVFIDDFFPVIKNTTDLKFCKPNGNELWAIILEKAWAKVNGGYVLTIGGWPSDALICLTGYACQKITHSEENIDNLWLTISNSDNANYIMCTNTISNSEIEKLGLVVNHAYTLIGAKEKINKFNIKDNIRLLRIRNPWGYKEWCGKYSDNSDIWTTELKGFFNDISIDDGTFYISMEDFYKYFANTQISHIMYDSNYRTFHLTNEMLVSPLFFILTVKNDEKFCFSLIFKHWRFNRNFTNAIHPSSIIVARLDENGDGKFTVLDFDGEFSSDDTIEYIRDLKKGTYFIWIHVNLEQCYPNPDKVVFRIISPCEFAVSYYGSDFYCTLIRKIFIEGLININKDTYDLSKEIYHSIDNGFRKSGIGYEIFSNKTNKTFKIECDISKIENFSLLPPYHKVKKNEKIIFNLGPNSSTIILAIRNTIGSYWLNISNEMKIIQNIDSKYVIEDFKENLKNLLEKNLQPIVDPIYYDFTFLSKEEISNKNDFKFQSINMKDVTLLKYKNEYKDYFDILLKLVPIENDQSLIWSKIIFKNGFYVGEVLEGKRHGRGVFCFTDGNYYIGYWENNQRNFSGKFFNSNKKLMYKGEILNGVKHGKGVQNFDNGGKYEGEFVNDARNGRGIFYFPNGNCWDGNFKDNQLHGEGILYSSDNLNKKISIYENGKLIH